MSCFFDPMHGQATEQVNWQPSYGVPRVIPVCAPCAGRVRYEQPQFNQTPLPPLQQAYPPVTPPGSYPPATSPGSGAQPPQQGSVGGAGLGGHGAAVAAGVGGLAAGALGGYALSEMTDNDNDGDNSYDSDDGDF